MSQYILRRFLSTDLTREPGDDDRKRSGVSRPVPWLVHPYSPDIDITLFSLLALCKRKSNFRLRHKNPETVNSDAPVPKLFNFLRKFPLSCRRIDFHILKQNIGQIKWAILSFWCLIFAFLAIFPLQLIMFFSLSSFLCFVLFLLLSYNLSCFFWKVSIFNCSSCGIRICRIHFSRIKLDL